MEPKLTGKVRCAIVELEKKNGRLDPSDIVNAAREKDSPLHPYFTWDDTEAAELYRRTQACELIRRVKIEITTHETTVRTVRYVSVPDSGKPNENDYFNLEKVQRESFREILLDELRRIDGNVKRTLSLLKANRYAQDEFLHGLKKISNIVSGLISLSEPQIEKRRIAAKRTINK